MWSQNQPQKTKFYNVHDMEYLWNLKKGLVEDSDTPAYDKIFDFASLSAGAALLAAKSAASHLHVHLDITSANMALHWVFIHVVSVT